MRHKQLEIARVVATFFVEFKELLIGQRIADGKLANLGPIDGVFRLIFIRDLQLGCVMSLRHLWMDFEDAPHLPW